MPATRIIDTDAVDGPCKLHVQVDCLVVKRADKEAVRVPLTEIECLVVGPQASLTTAVVTELAAAGTAIVFVDGRHLPLAMTLPLVGHTAQTARLAVQIERTPIVGDAVWAQIVRAKIAAQARLAGSDALAALVTEVTDGDPRNVEAHAARIYWPAVMGAGFNRDRDADDVNRSLNYGYAVLRATVARAVCSAGLHPSIGLHHRNRYDPFVLADDLMEPYRPVVDRACMKLGALTRETKGALLTSLFEPMETELGALSLFEVARRTAQSLVDVLRQTRSDLWIHAA